MQIFKHLLAFLFHLSPSATAACAGEGTLMIQFGVVDGRPWRAVEAVDNLRRRLVSSIGRPRRSVDTGAWILTSTLDNQTVTPTDLYNWTGIYSSAYLPSLAGLSDCWDQCLEQSARRCHVRIL